MNGLRRWFGAWVRDVPPLFSRTLSGNDWVTITNRLGEHSFCSDPSAVRCLSNQTSSLHVADVLPWTGKRILKAANRRWRFQWSDDPQQHSQPEISFLIPVRGTERLPLLLATIASLASLETPSEIIVIEQDEHSVIEDLPSSVRHIHAPHPSKDSRWHKCFAYNRGAEAARSDILVCHDGDIVVPTEYDQCIKRHLCQEDRDVFYPGRFLFYLTQETTAGVLTDKSFDRAVNATPELVKQNWTGGTLAVKRGAFESVGGFDESFTGWTGEDREFYDRCQTHDGMFHSYIPFLHLWHSPQTGRVDAESLRQANQFTADKLAIDRHERIKRLKSNQRLFAEDSSRS